MTAVIGKLFRIIECIAASEDDSVSLAKLTEQTGIPKATLYRLLNDLIEPGIVSHDHEGYALGSRLFELGNAVPRYQRLTDTASPYLEELAAVTGDTAHLATLHDREVLYLSKVPGRYHVRVPTSAGTRVPPMSTALGKVLVGWSAPQVREEVVMAGVRPRTRNTVVLPHLIMRQLVQARRDGFATEIEEFKLGVGCVAAPIFDSMGAVVAAVSISGDPSTKRAGMLPRQLSKIAERISMEYQHRVAENTRRREAIA